MNILYIFVFVIIIYLYFSSRTGISIARPQDMIESGEILREKGEKYVEKAIDTLKLFDNTSKLEAQELFYTRSTNLAQNFRRNLISKAEYKKAISDLMRQRREWEEQHGDTL